MLNFFTSDLRRNLIKVLCLTMGLAVGFIIIAKVFFEKTFDTFYPDSDRIYYVAESFNRSGEYYEFPQTPGAIGENVKDYVPQVEEAARWLPVSYGDRTIKREDETTVTAMGVSLVDSCFFDVFAMPVISGNAREALSVPNSCMISESLAERMGGDVMGKTFVFEEDETDVFRIEGIYKDFPPNSTIGCDIFISMATGPEQLGASRKNWMGNDRFRAFVKLAEGSEESEVNEALNAMLRANADEEVIKRSNLVLRIHPVSEFYENVDGVSSSITILGVLAVVMIISASLNFLLVVIGQLPRRSKEMAVRKCYGTSASRIFFRGVAEGLFYVVTSIALAILIVSCFPGMSRQLLGRTPGEIFAAPGLWGIIACVVLILLTVSSVIPGIMYCRTPVARAFRVNIKNRKRWKLILLSVQFVASGMLLCLLLLVGRQYRMLQSLDFGVDYTHLAEVHGGKNRSQRAELIRTLKEMPGVEGVSSIETALLGGASGNNVSLEGDTDKELNVADMYGTNPDFFEVVGMRFLQGETFREDADSTVFEVVVDRQFAEEMERVFGWDSNDVIGKGFRISEHMESYIPEFTIAGVVNNVRRGGLEVESTDRRGTVYFPAGGAQRRVYVRFSEITPEVLQRTQETLNSVVTDSEIVVEPLELRVNAKMETTRIFGLAIGIIGFSILVITLIGLMGYTSDEVLRRSREIAVRRLTGTSTLGIVSLFCREVMIVAVPSLMAGGALAVIFGRKILALYSESVSLSPLSMLLCLIVIGVLISVVVVANTLGVARDNLSSHLRSE